MKKKQIALKLFLCIALLFECDLSNAQYNLSGRSVAMSSCNVNFQDEWSVFQNPGGIADLKVFSSAISFKNNYLAKELSRQSFAVNIPLKSYGTSSFGFTQTGYQLYREQNFSGAFARSYNEKISGGISLQYSSVKIGEGSGSVSVIKINAGIQIKISNALQLGILINNPFRPKVSTYNNEKSDASVNTGIAYQFSKKLSCFIQADDCSEQHPSFRMAMEYCPVKDFFLRGGIASEPLTESFGFGYKWKNIKIDIATAYHSKLGYYPVLSLIYFNSVKNQE